MADFTPSPKSGEDEPANPTADDVIRSTEDNDRMSDVDEGSPRSTKRKTPSVSDDEEEEEEEEEEENLDNADPGGLFGSGSEDEGGSPKGKRRRLDDEELDSGDDEDRRDRMDEDAEEEYEQKSISMASISFGRHALPKGSDGELYHFRHPPFLGIEPKGFSPQSFRVPDTPHHSTTPSSTFSASQTANNTIRWRYDPSDPDKVQSNARILRWADGSLTLQIASAPTVQHELPVKPLAPPQPAPLKPTPISKQAKPGFPTNGSKYDPNMDTHTYLAVVISEIGFAHLTNHVTAALTVQASNDEDDDAVVQLQEAMSKAAGAKAGSSVGPTLIDTREDPEMAKRKAEQAEKEKIRAEKRRATQAERDRERANRTIGRTGMRAGPGLGGLEDDELGLGAGGIGGLRGSRAKPGGAKGKSRGAGPARRRRRNSEYSDDEEETGFRRGKTFEDEYDEGDGFLVGSDEEPEVVDDDDDEEEELDDLGEADAEGEVDDEAPVKASNAGEKSDEVQAAGESQAVPRGKRRRVVEDEDE